MEMNLTHKEGLMKSNQELALRAVVGEAILAIQHQAATYTKQAKPSYGGDREDLVTSADRLAQEIYVRAFKRDFPGFGIIGEEDGLNVEADAQNIGRYFTVDPLDGTRAFARNSSHGVGTMCALVDQDEVRAAYVGDANTGEIYGYFGDGPMTRTRFGVETTMSLDPNLPLSVQYALLAESHYEFPNTVARMVCNGKNGGIVRGYEVSHGSIGLIFSRLWKGEVAMVVLPPYHTTPWDWAPVIGINRKMDIVHVAVDPKTFRAEVNAPKLPKNIIKREYFEVCVHKSHVPAVLGFLNGN